MKKNRRAPPIPVSEANEVGKAG
ncbi:MAG: hypothetical protein JWN14_4931, partial [Chthonomonadales bacterium]|nr:hypothetical protein [Chthonomonadales bacterium]